MTVALARTVVDTQETPTARAILQFEGATTPTLRFSPYSIGFPWHTPPSVCKWLRSMLVVAIMPHYIMYVNAFRAPSFLPALKLQARLGSGGPPAGPDACAALRGGVRALVGTPPTHQEASDTLAIGRGRRV